MSKGFIYFAKNITGYKLGFTKNKLSDAIKNLNTSQIIENFTLVDAIRVNYPKKIKNEISKKLVDKRIHKDLYDISHNDISDILLDIEIELNLSTFLERYDKIYMNNDTINIYLDKNEYYLKN